MDETELMARRLTGGLPDEIEARAQPLGQAVVRVDHGMHERGEEVTLSFAGGDLLLTARADTPGVIEVKWLDPTMRMLVATIMETAHSNPEPAEGMPFFTVERGAEPPSGDPEKLPHAPAYEVGEFGPVHSITWGLKPWWRVAPWRWPARLARWWRGDDLREREAAGDFPAYLFDVARKRLGDDHEVVRERLRELRLDAARRRIRERFDADAPEELRTDGLSFWHEMTEPMVEELAQMEVAIEAGEVEAEGVDVMPGSCDCPKDERGPLFTKHAYGCPEAPLAKWPGMTTCGAFRDPYAFDGVPTPLVLRSCEREPGHEPPHRISWQAGESLDGSERWEAGFHEWGGTPAHSSAAYTRREGADDGR
jgi:hypothetical protein